MMNSILMTLLSPDAYTILTAVLLALFSLLVFFLSRLVRRRWLRWLVWAITLFFWYVLFYGTFVGFTRLEVRHVEYASADLPAAFDGYRIAFFSDAHVGTLTGTRRPLLERVVDSINAQHADVICFVGDLQNQHPDEIAAARPLLKRLKARDGVYSVLGNHDYAEYSGLTDDYERAMLCEEVCRQEGLLGWRLLLNTHCYIRRGSDSIVIAGMENDGDGRFPQLGSIPNALWGVRRSDFIVMLEHDPTSWRRRILPQCHAQLTLSGHTHGGHLSLLGLSPAAIRYREYEGLYHVGPRALYVTKGVGGVVPFRFGTPAEIVVITLRKR